ncbi:MAG TPA: tetratricopeptide repeat protein [Gemmatimonadales bacterium]|nr:tetratricopeptide repeat protein [Gemmatimonadales bacterium]
MTIDAGGSWAGEWAFFRQTEGWSAAGRHRDVLEALERLPAEVRERRTRSALLAAEANGRLGNYAEAARWADLAATLARTQGEAHAELRARNYCGAIALRHGDVAEAEQHFEAAIEMARALRDHTTEARALNNLGILANIRGDPEAALANYRLALVAYQHVGHVRGMAETYHNIGISLRHQGNAQAALGAAEEAVRLATQVADEQLIALTSTGRAELHVLTGDPAFARAELQRAEERYTRIGFRAGLPEVWRVHAAVARAMHDLALAVFLLRRAADLATEFGSTDTLADIERDLSASLAASGDITGARAARERAAALYQRIGAAHAAAQLPQL